MLYRIFTEDKNTEALHDLISKRFDGFTSYTALGYWKGIAEASRVIEIIDLLNIQANVRALCYEIKQLNNQESVLFQTLENEHEFI